MKVSDFDYELPESSIARYPPDERGSTRLLVLQRSAGELIHCRYAGLDGFLQKGDLVVLNNSRVVKARMFANKPTGGKIELVLLEKHGDEQNLVLYRGSLKKGDTLLAYGCEFHIDKIVGQGIAGLSVKSGGTVQEIFERYAAMPIPPYLKRDAEEIDRERYQTVFAEQPGSVAAPTASLNMTDELLEKLREKGVSIASMTLHVGLGTFLPIRVDHFEEHVMHREFYVIPDETLSLIRTTKSNGGRVMAVGTTVTRALEHAADSIMGSNGNGSVSGEADIFIYPGYRFQVIDALLTNFHAPRSTVLMLTAAFAGHENLFEAYSEALRSGYDFLSYGDSMLIL
ncbi:MAG: tRNA preQ1(34) S-adenosylmethionine ribosyltransferase-isomerase QueA [Chlorobiaceae bacterium]|nr:tRNA preQ1(34) S-adenosylmethionine ribosyltransferase-isomerase QueA [Chlorobiaceae bacterium]NTW63724.1 tRNA preQ1(34) S-adenosylmethionine ribosyltransferase-isomerase QueA [Chlorobiaceae bacterium]